MPGLDTNVLVRWLIDDDREQVERVLELFESTREKSYRHTLRVLLRWIWSGALRSRYKYDKRSVITAFNALLETQEIQFQEEAALEHALHLCRLGPAEFADCLHAGLCRAADRAPLLTFDAKAARLESVEMLTTQR